MAVETPLEEWKTIPQTWKWKQGMSTTYGMFLTLHKFCDKKIWQKKEDIFIHIIWKIVKSTTNLKGILI